MQRILNKREKIILFSAIGIIIFSFGFNIIIEPILTRNENINKEINMTRVKLKKYLQLLSEKEYIQNKFNKFSVSFKHSGSEENPFVNALADIESLAKASNIRIVDIRPQNPKNLELYKEILIDLRTEGDIESYLKFVYNIENSLSLLRIKKIQLNAKPNTQSLEGSLSISQISLD